MKREKQIGVRVESIDLLALQRNIRVTNSDKQIPQNTSKIR